MGHLAAMTGSITGSTLVSRVAGCALLGLALSSCKEPSDKPSGEEPQSVTSTEATTPPEKSSLPTKTEPTHAGQVVYYFAKGTLFGQEHGAKREALTSISGPQFCVSDPGHNAVWFLGDTGLSLYDLESKSQELIVNTAKKPIEAFEVRFGDGQGKVGNANDLEDMAALVLMLTEAEVSLRAEVLCDGDLSHTCFIEDGDDPEVWEHTEELKELLAGYKMLRLQEEGKATLQSLAGRKPAIETTAPQAAPPAPKVAIDKSKCEEEPEDCGTGEFLGGSYWKIITENSRGDFYHERYGLYDSKRAGWVKPGTGQLVKSPSNATFELLALASDRSSMLTTSGAWFSFQEGTTTLQLGKDSAFCGFGK